jgi:SNF2 family DNA or RNA helicase
MILLERYDQKVTRVCAQTPYSTKDAARTIPGARWDADWKSPLDPTRHAKVWHWPTPSLPAVLRAFPDAATHDPLIQRGMQRAAEVNVGREKTRQLARAALEAGISTAPAGITLYQHQPAAFGRVLRFGPSRALYHDTGTGKTITASMLLDLFVRDEEGLRVGIVVCPMIAIWDTWLPNVSKWFPGVPTVNLRGKKKGHDREYALHDVVNRKGRAVGVVNYETVRTDPRVRACMGGAFVILDESSALKDGKAKITQVMQEIAPTFRAVILLSGTPAPNTPLEYYPQMKVIAACGDYDPFPGTKTMFSETYCRREKVARRFNHKTGEYEDVMESVPREEMIQQMYERMAPVAEWIKREECIDLPAKVFTDIDVPLDANTAARYAEMRDLMCVTIRDHYGDSLRSHATNALAQYMRLRQITAGFVPAFPEKWAAGDDSDGQVMVSLGREKLDWLLEFVETHNERILVWTQFVPELQRVMKSLAERKVPSDFIDGSVDRNERSPILDRFRAGDLKVVVAHPRTMKYSVSIPGVSLSAYLSCSNSAEEYLQSQDRIHGIGRGDPTKHSTFYRLLAKASGADTVDHEIQACLDGKEDLQSIVFRIDAERRKNAAATS